MRSLLITIILCRFIFSSPASYVSKSFVKDSILVTFIVETENLPEDSSVYITGNLEKIGHWRSDSIRMQYSGGNRWIKTIYVKDSAFIEYKYTLGSWDREGASAEGQPLDNLALKVSGDTVIYDKILYWTNPVKRIISGQITGKVVYHYSFSGKEIRNRDIIVWLPPDYGEDSSLKYPVLYMHDGQNIFDPVTSAFGVDWQMDESADSLIRQKIISPVILVGIYNTPDRSKEYIPGEKGTAYMNFVVHELKAYIDSVYPTLPDKDNTFTGGSSAGGLISFMLAWEYPQIFSGAICMSPALKIKDIDYVANVSSYNQKKKDLRFYIDVGGVGVETRLQTGIEEMISELKVKGYQEGKDLLYRKFSEAEHFESAWAERIPEALKFLFGY